MELSATRVASLASAADFAVSKTPAAAHQDPPQAPHRLSRPSCLWSRTVAARGGRSPARMPANLATDGLGGPLLSLLLVALSDTLDKRR